MATLRDWLPLVEGEAPGADVSEAERAIRSAAIQFCSGAEWWVQTLAAIPLVAVTADYVLAPPAEAEVANILRVEEAKREVYLRSREELDCLYPGWDGPDAPTGIQPVYYFRPDPPRSIRLVPTPTTASVDAELSVVVRVALKPTRTTSTLDDRLYEAENAIKWAALGILLDTSKSWGDRARAQNYRARYQEELARFRIRAETGDGRRPLMARTASWSGGARGESFPFDW